MAMMDFSIDTSGSPQDVQRKQALADALMKQGSDSTPAAGGKNGGWVTALNRGLAGALGGYQRGQAANEEQQGRESARQQLANGLMGADGKVNPQAYINAASNPWVNPQQIGAIGKVSDWKHQSDQDAEHKREFGITSGFQANADKRAAAAEGRAASDFENTPDQYVANPKANEPGQPAYIDQYAAATAAAGSGKPIPFETLGGTRFLVPQPGGGYSSLDPTKVGQPQPSNIPGAAPTPPQPSSAGATAAPLPPPDTESVDPKTGRREGFLKSQEAGVQDYIKKIADYEIDPRTTSVKGGSREHLLSAVAHYDPTYDQNNFATRAKAMKDFGTGSQGNSVRSFDVAIDHLDTLQRYTKAMKNGDIPALNAIRNAWRQETGSELPTDVQAIAPIVGAEVTKAIIGSQNALADREELRKPLSASRSPEQLNGAIEGYKSLMGGQLKGLKKQYEDTTGKKNFDSRVRESTRNVLLGEGGGAKESSGAAKAPPAVGDVVKGHKFLGGDPSNPASWATVDSM